MMKAADIRGLAKEGIWNKIQAAKAELKRLETAANMIGGNRGKNLLLQVEIENAMTASRKGRICLTRDKSLKEMIEQATQEFAKKNGDPRMPAEYKVSVLVGEVEIEIPKKLYDELIPESAA